MISPTSFAGTLESSGTATGPTGHAAISRQEALYDAELVKRFHAGDDAAFVEIVTRYRGKMFSIALSLLRNHADAEEITQDTFIRAHRGLARFRGDSSLATWLHRIALNLSRNRYWYFFRRHRQDTRSLDCALSDNSPSTVADLVASDAPSPAREEANREFLGHVTVCMEKLSAQQREILTLRNGLDRSYNDIAQALGISIGTVKSRIARARENLRTLLAEMYAECEPATSSPFQCFEPSRPSSHLSVACA
ncbi:MAG TPA: sigma-70 family RNA polymerase sigma factor [Opitutaceae bacterium]|jgi:RNA polymerase sigma-70 factor (ECF subfamily)|nr:sigma-70 family RNA polymerase sigma factor [Opitutaceae bacterium]